jgi:F-type H+-transporting ATPase subunit epsilon
MSFQVRLIAPEGVVASERVISVKVPTVNGEIGVMANHADMLSLMGVGIATLEKEDGSKISYVVREGICKIADGNCDLVTDRVTTHSTSGIAASELSARIETSKESLKAANLFDASWSVKQADLKELESLAKL